MIGFDGMVIKIIKSKEGHFSFFPPAGYLFKDQLLLTGFAGYPEEVIAVKRTFLTTTGETETAAREWLLIRMIQGQVRLVEAECR